MRIPSRGHGPQSARGASLLSVNLAVPRLTPTKTGTTGIDKRPTTRSVLVRAPGPRADGPGSGLVGDRIFDRRYHGGDDRAVYAFGREQLDWWQGELARELADGSFGENLTTRGLDVDGALLGERWQVGTDVVLSVTGPRIPCVTFAHWMPERGWLKRFTAHAMPGAYLRVEKPGYIGAGDPITVLDRPQHDVSVEIAFRAMTIHRELLPRLLSIDDQYLTEDTRDYIENWMRRPRVSPSSKARGSRALTTTPGGPSRLRTDDTRSVNAPLGHTEAADPGSRST